MTHQCPRTPLLNPYLVVQSSFSHHSEPSSLQPQHVNVIMCGSQLYHFLAILPWESTTRQSYPLYLRRNTDLLQASGQAQVSAEILSVIPSASRNLKLVQQSMGVMPILLRSVLCNEKQSARTIPSSITLTMRVRKKPQNLHKFPASQPILAKEATPALVQLHQCLSVAFPHRMYLQVTV